MSSDASHQMTALLHELALLKEIDSARQPRTREEKAARRERQRRRAELSQQIKDLGRIKKKDQS